MVKTTKRINVYEGRGIGKRTIVSAWDKKRRRMDLWGEGQTEELNWIYHVHSRWLIQFDHRNGIQLFHSGMVERTLPRNASILYIYIGGWARARKSTTVRNSWRHQLRVEAPSTYFSTRETSAIVLRGAWIVLEYRASALQSICLLLLRVRPSYWSPHVPNTRERIRAED